MMGKYLEMLDDEDCEMSLDEINEATAELAEELFGEEAARQLRAKLGLKTSAN